MEIEAAKLLAAGLATVGIGLSAVGVGIVFATARRQPSRPGLLLTGGFGVACLLIALILLFVV